MFFGKKFIREVLALSGKLSVSERGFHLSDNFSTRSEAAWSLEVPANRKETS